MCGIVVVVLTMVEVMVEIIVVVTVIAGVNDGGGAKNKNRKNSCVKSLTFIALVYVPSFALFVYVHRLKQKSSQLTHFGELVAVATKNMSIGESRRPVWLESRPA